MTTHTPGPWWVDTHSNGIIYVEADQTVHGICDLYHKNHEDDSIVQKGNAGPNARLIAAAPDMFTALQSMQAKLRWMRWIPGFMKAARQAQKALTRAGESS